MFNYIVINSDDVIVGISTLSSEVSEPFMILVDHVDMLMIFKKYNKETGELE